MLVSRYNDGVRKGKIETAKNLLAMGLSIDKISQATGLDVDVVERLVMNSDDE